MAATDGTSEPSRHTRRARLYVLGAAIATGTAMLLTTPVAAHAATTIRVTTTVDETTVNGSCSLREALRAADTDTAVDTCAAGSGRDTIVVPSGRITLRLGELGAHSAMSIVGAGRGTIIDGGGVGVAVRGVHVAAGAQATISHLTVAHTYSAFRNDGTLTLIHVNVIANGFDASNTSASTYGASAIDNRGTLTVTHSFVAGNGDLADLWQSPSIVRNAAGTSASITWSTFAAAAPGISLADPAFVNDGATTVANTVFDGVETPDLDATSGVEFDNHGTVALSSVSFTHSWAALGGAAVANTGTAALDRVTITNDFGALANSGALHVNNSTIAHNFTWFGLVTNTAAGRLQIASTAIVGNQEMENAATVVNRGNAVLTNVTIANNLATAYVDDGAHRQGAGGIDNRGILTGRNITVTGNRYDALDPSLSDPIEAGGVLNRPGGTLYLANSIVAGNTVGNSPTPARDCHGVITSLGYDLVQDTTRCTLTGTATGLITGVDPALSPVASNGTAALLEMPNSGSPVIDRGNPAPPSSTTATCVRFDERGVNRPLDGDHDGVARCDIGAVER